MLRAKTVLVLGAGASVEVGLPVGSELLHQICSLTNISFEFGTRQNRGDVKIVEALKSFLDEGQSVQELNEHIEAGWTLSRSAKQALSIDNVIEALEDQRITTLGKLGIARAILKAERNSHHFSREERGDRSINTDNFKDTWFRYFTQIITENIKVGEVENLFENISIINFNYDRCIEMYLPHSISQYYGISLADARKAVNRLQIFRPYGSVGLLSWQTRDGIKTPFGDCSSAELVDAHKNIRTFTEQIDDQNYINSIRTELSNADRIIFLGFAFHRQNVQLLSTELSPHAKILATTMGISPSDKQVILSEIVESFGMGHTIDPRGRITMVDMTCEAFFKAHRLTLTAAAS